MSERAEGLLAQLSLHSVNDALEEEHLRSVEALLAQTAQPFDRSQYTPGHITASSYVLDKDMRHVLLIFHSKLHRWLQPGGHVEASDQDIEAAARREVHEETALSDLELMGTGILDVDVHEIPARGELPAHRHFDVRLLFRMRSGSAEAGSDAQAVRWVPLDALDTIETDESVMRAVRKIRERVEGTSGARWCAAEVRARILRMEVTPWLPPALCELLRRQRKALDVEVCPDAVVDGARIGLYAVPTASVPSWVAAELRGRELARAGATDRARIVFEEALEETPLAEVEQRALLCGLLAQARMLDGHYERSERAWREALELSLQAGQLREADICRLGLSTCRAHQDDRAGARGWATNVFDGPSEPAVRYRAAERLLTLGGRWGAYREALEACMSARSWWGQTEHQAEVLARSARFAADYGQEEDALAWWDASATLFDRSGVPERARAARVNSIRLLHREADVVDGDGPSAVFWRAECALRDGDAMTAQRLAYRALASAEAQGEPRAMLDATCLLAIVRLIRGDPGDALHRFERCRRDHAEALHTVGESAMCSMLVASEMLLGRVAEATQRSMEVRGHPDAPHVAKLAGYAERIVTLGGLDPLQLRNRRTLGPLGYGERLEVAVLKALYVSLQEAACS